MQQGRKGWGGGRSYLVSPSWVSHLVLLWVPRCPWTCCSSDTCRHSCRSVSELGVHQSREGVPGQGLRSGVCSGLSWFSFLHKIMNFSSIRKEKIRSLAKLATPKLKGEGLLARVRGDVRTTCTSGLLLPQPICLLVAYGKAECLQRSESVCESFGSSRPGHTHVRHCHLVHAAHCYTEMSDAPYALVLAWAWVGRFEERK